MNLFIELRRHRKLAEKRHPMYENSRFAKFGIYVTAIFWAGYLVFFGTLFAFAFEDEAVEPYHVLNAGLAFFLILDFMLRFLYQKTPAQEVKPYLLLPVKRNRLIDFLLVRSGLGGFNFIWLFLFVPFALLTVTKFYGLWGAFTYCAGIWLLMLFNNYWFLLCRTLLGERIWWLLLPACVYGGLLAALFIPDGRPLFDWFVSLGDAYITGNVFAFLGTLAAIALVWLAGSRVIRKFIYNELNKVKDSTMQAKRLSEYEFLDRYGITGEYMRLELKLLLRNRVCRGSLAGLIFIVVFFSAMAGFTDAYGDGVQDFIVLYCYVMFAISLLGSLMSEEGNYIDGLMSWRASIRALLQAKYEFYLAALSVPFLLMLPGVAWGGIGLLQSVSWMVFTGGAGYFCFFMACPYNKHTLNLNMKMTGRMNMSTGQSLMNFAAFALPFAIYVPLKLLVYETAARWIMIAIGAGFIASSRQWLKYVCKRFMQRRYQNMEGFRDSRQR